MSAQREDPDREANLPLVVQPDPALREGRAHPLRVAATVIGAVAVIILVFYGLTREPRHESTTTAPAATTATGGAPPATTGQAPVPSGNAGATTGQAQPPSSTAGSSPPDGERPAANTTPPTPADSRSTPPPPATGR